MSKVLIIHHVQEMWRQGMNNSGVSMDDYRRRLRKHLEKSEYDKIIVTNFEAGVNLDDEQQFIYGMAPVLMVEDYCYGWEIDSLSMKSSRKEKLRNGDSGLFKDKYGEMWAAGAYHSECVPIPDWMPKLAGHDVYLCGAFRGECIEDMEVALSAAKINFTLLDKYTV